MYKIIISLFILFFHSALAWSNGTKVSERIDSLNAYVLKHQWDKAEESMKKINEETLSTKEYPLFHVLKGKIAVNNKQFLEGRKNYRKVIEFAKKSSDIDYQTRGLYLIGISFFAESKQDSASYYWKQVLDFREIPNYGKQTKYVCHAYNGLGVVEKRKGNITESIRYYESALREDLEYGYGAAHLYYNNLTNAYYVKKDYFKTAEYALKTIKINEELGDSILVANNYITLSKLYLIQRNPKKALRMLDIAEELVCPFFHAEEKLYHNVIGEMGNCYLYLNDYDRAYDYYRQDSAYLATTYQDIDKMTSHIELGKYYRLVDKYQPSKMQFQKAHHYLLKHNFRNHLPRLHLEKGFLHHDMMELDSAIYNLKKAIEYNKTFPNFEILRDAYNALFMIYQDSQKPQLANQYAEQAILYSDSLQQQMLPINITSYIVEYEKEKENQLIIKEQRWMQDSLKMSKTINVLLGLSFLFLLLASFFGYKTFQHKKRYAQKLQADVKQKTEELNIANNELKQSHEELKIFYALMAHDLSYPILFVKAKLEDLELLLPTAIEAQLKITESKNALMQLQNSFKRLLNFFKMDNEPLNIKKVNSYLLLNDVVREFQAIDTLKNLKVHYENDLHDIQGDVLLIRQVFTNLITNAVKFTANSAQPTLKITSQKIDNKIHIFFNDNGTGISTEIQRNIFQSFFSGNKTNSKSLGIGLFFVKRIMERHEGKIIVHSSGEEGATFELIFPSSKTHSHTSNAGKNSI